MDRSNDIIIRFFGVPGSVARNTARQMGANKAYAKTKDSMAGVFKRYEWTKENGIFRLTIDARIQKKIRPVFHEELDFFGMDEYWDYPKDTSAPLLWAEGGFYTKPVIKRLTNERLILKPIDVNRLYEVNKSIMLSMEQKAITFIQNQHEHYAVDGYSFVCAFSGGKDSFLLLDLWQHRTVRRPRCHGSNL